MLDFVPFMLLAAIVIVAMATWGARSAGIGGDLDRDQLERLPEAEAMFRDCLREHGFTPPRVSIYRDTKEGGLVIFGDEEIPRLMQPAFAECDRQISARFANGAHRE